MTRRSKNDWSSWMVVAIAVIIALLVCLVVESDLLGNAIDQYFQIGEYER